MKDQSRRPRLGPDAPWLLCSKWAEGETRWATSGHQEQRLRCPCLCGVRVWGYLRAPFYPIGVSCPGQDPEFLTADPSLRIGKALGQPTVWRVRLRLRELWLAPHHMGVASVGAGSQVSVSQTQRQCLTSRAWAWAWAWVEGS